MQIVVALFWLRYAWYRIFGHSIPRKNEAFYVLVPFIILSMIVIASPLNGWCFYLDDANYYHRGVLSAPMSVVILAYLLSVSVIALSQYRKEVLIGRKKELLTIAFFCSTSVSGRSCADSFLWTQHGMALCGRFQSDDST